MWLSSHLLVHCTVLGLLRQMPTREPHYNVGPGGLSVPWLALDNSTPPLVTVLAMASGCGLLFYTMRIKACLQSHQALFAILHTVNDLHSWVFRLKGR